MTKEGPPIQTLTHRLGETPADFLAEATDAAAVVSDLSRDLGGSLLTEKELTVFRQKAKAERNRLRIVLIASWLLHDPWFRAQKNLSWPAVRFLTSGLEDLSPLVDAQKFVTDPDRREELARLCLQALGLRPAGEREAQATDRLNTLSSVERNRVINETRAAQERIRKIREAMRKKAAEEAAAVYGRE